MTIDAPTTARFPRSAVPVWIVVAVGAVMVGALAPASMLLASLPIVLFAGIMTTFVIQLALDQKAGLVLRVIISLGGAIALLGIASVVFGVFAHAAG